MRSKKEEGIAIGCTFEELSKHELGLVRVRTMYCTQVLELILVDLAACNTAATIHVRRVIKQ